MNQEQDKDRALAAYTDALLAAKVDSLADRSVPDSVDPELAETVALLARTIGESTPPEALRRKTQRWVISNWSNKGQMAARLRGLFRGVGARPVVVLGTLSALGLIIVLLTILFPSDSSQVSGTVVGDTLWVGLALVLAGAVCAVIWLAIRRRRH